MTLVSPTPVDVRRAHPEDWRALRDLRLRALRSDPQAFGSTLEVKLAYPEARWRELAETGARSADFSTWVAVSGSGRLVGMTVVALLTGVPNLLGMWVEPAFRGRGVGGRLLDRAIAWIAETHPFIPVRLEVNPKQVRAIRLYQSRGFRFTGAVRPLGVISAHEVVQEMVARPPLRHEGQVPPPRKVLVPIPG